MPFYDYVCDECGHCFETQQSIADKKLTDCPVCGKTSLRRLITTSRLVFKGPGFYVNDYGRGHSEEHDD